MPLLSLLSPQSARPAWRVRPTCRLRCARPPVRMLAMPSRRESAGRTAPRGRNAMNTPYVFKRYTFGEDGKVLKPGGRFPVVMKIKRYTFGGNGEFNVGVKMSNHAESISKRAVRRDNDRDITRQPGQSRTRTSAKSSRRKPLPSLRQADLGATSDQASDSHLGPLRPPFKKPGNSRALASGPNVIYPDDEDNVRWYTFRKGHFRRTGGASEIYKVSERRGGRLIFLHRIRLDGDRVVASPNPKPGKGSPNGESHGSARPGSGARFTQQLVDVPAASSKPVPKEGTHDGESHGSANPGLGSRVTQQLAEEMLSFMEKNGLNSAPDRLAFWIQRMSEQLNTLRALRARHADSFKADLTEAVRALASQRLRELTAIRLELVHGTFVRARNVFRELRDKDEETPFHPVILTNLQTATNEYLAKLRQYNMIPMSDSPVEPTHQSIQRELVALENQLDSSLSEIRRALSPGSANASRILAGLDSDDSLDGSALLEELFPEVNPLEHRPRKAEPEKKAEPKLFSPDPTADPKYSLIRKAPLVTKKELIAEAFQARGERNTVLSLRGLSPNLAAIDFRRLSPSGSKHIEGWAGRGDFTKVIPIRDPRTLEANGNYYLLFATSSAAVEYQKHLSLMHRLSQRYTSSGLTSPIIPAPGDPGDETDEHAHLVRSYALIPPTQKEVHANMLLQPYRREVKTFLDRGGYAQIHDGRKRRVAKVLFFLDGPQAKLPAIRHALIAIGNARGLDWGIVYETITKLDEGGKEKEGSQRLEPGDHRRRWVFEFESDVLANRFVRAWHMRPLSTGRGDEGDGRQEPPPVVRASVLW